MKRCDEVRGLFGPYWDDEVTQAEREWLETHLADCVDCRARYESLARTLETVAALPRAEMGEGLAARALAAARRAPTVPDRVVVTRALPTWVPTAAAAAAVLVVGFALWPRLASLGGLRPAREVPVAEPRLMAVATAPAAPAEPASSVTTVTDTLFDHADDVEFILDPVVLHRGRAQTASSLPDGVQGEQTVISF